MSARLTGRLAALGVSAALVAGGVTLASSAPAHAASATPASGTATYACKTLLGSVGTISVIPDVPIPDGSGTADLPITAVVDGAIGQQGLLTGLLTTLSTALGLPLSQVTGGATGGAETLEGILTTLPIDTKTNTLPVPLPDTLSLGALGDLLGVVCDLAAPLDALPIPDLPGLPGTGAGGTTGGTGTTTPSKPAPKPVAHKPAKKPAKHAANMRAKSVKWRIHHRAHPKVRVQVRTMGHAAKGKVVAHVGKRLVGHGWLKNGKVTLTLKKLARGKRSVRINYLGNSAVRAAHRWVSYKVVK